jgi:hypothetical protein
MLGKKEKQLPQVEKIIRAWIVRRTPELIIIKKGKRYTRETWFSLCWARRRKSAFVVVNHGSQDIVVHLLQNPLSAHC